MGQLLAAEKDKMVGADETGWPWGVHANVYKM